MTYLELALYALQQLARPAGASEIWDFIEQNRFYAELDGYNPEQGLVSIGKTPWATVGAALYVEAKKPDGKITAQGSRPKLFSLRQAVSGSLKALPLPENAAALPPAAQPQKARFHERDLHPLLCKFLAEHPLFAAQSRTIFHEKSGKSQKGADKWLYPDMVGVQFEYADYEHSSLQAWMRKFDRLPIKIFSFEIKKHLDFGNYKEYFFPGSQQFQLGERRLFGGIVRAAGRRVPRSPAETQPKFRHRHHSAGRGQPQPKRNPVAREI